MTLCRYHHAQLHKREFRITKERLPPSNSQDLTQNPTLFFINRKNEIIFKNLYPQFTNPGESTESIEMLSDEVGLNISRDTAASKWQGDQLDVYYAVEILFGLDGEPC